MINRYEGNTGRVTRLPEQHDLHPPPPPERRPPPPPPGYRPPSPLPGLDLRRLLPGIGDLETEDLLLLLILYLMYRESGDQELLIIMGAMFLL